MTGSRIFHYDPELKLPAASHPVAKTLVRKKKEID